jgi:hypothetical protein
MFKIIQHIHSGDTFTAQIDDNQQITALSEPMYYRHVEAGDGYQDLTTLEEPIEMDDYRVVNEAPNVG